VILIVASRFDAEAAAFCASLGADAGDAALLLPEDLSQRGWLFDPDDVARSQAIASGRAVPCRSITGVLTLLPRVEEWELVHIVEEDRPYVAAEMTAFLLAWLAALPPSVNVINRPQAGCLAGPPWSPLRWRHEAALAGFRISGGQSPSFAVTVAGGRALDSAGPETAARARNLASAACVEVLSLALDAQHAFVAASSRPALGRPGIDRTMRELLGVGKG
jgi:diadenosine tetraphosphatase ApaH/serine/threonine PP2A family protein phosphatase